MRKKQVQFIIFFLFSIIFIVSASSITFAQIPSPQRSSVSAFVDKTFLQNVAVTILSAVLAFSSGYVLAGINKFKSGSSKRLSYSLDIETGIVNIKENIKQKVRVLYEDKEIINLSNINFDIENTGNSVIKSQEIRFEFSSETRILDFYFDPQPLPEMKAELINDPGLRSFEKKCRISHIEKGQTLTMRFVVTSDSEIKLIPHPYNENGDVEFLSRSTTKTLSEREQVAKFLSLLIMYYVIPPVFSLFSLSLFSVTIGGLVRLGFLLFLFRFIAPFSETVAELISTWLNPEDKNSVSLLNVEVGGDLNIADVNKRYG